MINCRDALKLGAFGMAASLPLSPARSEQVAHDGDLDGPRATRLARSFPGRTIGELS